LIFVVIVMVLIMMMRAMMMMMMMMIAMRARSVGGVAIVLGGNELGSRRCDG
jgi:hypothetical protein